MKAYWNNLIFIRKKEDEKVNETGSLRYCIRSYDELEIKQTDEEKQFLNELLLRNEITHDYFNREIHQQKLISMMQNSMVGSADVYRHLYDYCKKRDWLILFADRVQDRKK